MVMMTKMLIWKNANPKPNKTIVIMIWYPEFCSCWQQVLEGHSCCLPRFSAFSSHYNNCYWPKNKVRRKENLCSFSKAFISETRCSNPEDEGSGMVLGKKIAIGIWIWIVYPWSVFSSSWSSLSSEDDSMRSETEVRSWTFGSRSPMPKISHRHNDKSASLRPNCFSAPTVCQLPILATMNSRRRWAEQSWISF